MVKLHTLRNIIPLFVVLFCAACSNNEDGNALSSNDKVTSSNDKVTSISSEDKYSELIKVGEIQDAESGQTIYVVSKK